jgi:hypothetical protein
MVEKSAPKPPKSLKPGGEKPPRRQVRPFPAHAFEEALQFAQTIQNSSGNQPIRRLTLFDELGKSPESSASRTLITSAFKYGLVKGSYKSEALELTDLGSRATSPDRPAKDKAHARFEAAIEQVPLFKSLYEKHQGQRLPSSAVLLDSAKSEGAPADGAQEAIDTFVSNLKFVGLLRTLSGAERVLSVDHVMESLQPAHTPDRAQAQDQVTELPREQALITDDAATFEQTCFVISPIGDEGSEFRQHANLFLSSLIEPALESLHLKVVRADQIATSGIITKQIIEYVWKSRLVIADLSFHNPNVFYELAIRHASNRPVIQLIRQADKIPFDLQQSRTIVIDTTDIYSLVPKIDTYRSEIATHARRALEEGAAIDNPLTIYLPEVFKTR